MAQGGSSQAVQSFVVALGHVSRLFSMTWLTCQSWSACPVVDSGGSDTAVVCGLAASPPPPPIPQSAEPPLCHARCCVVLLAAVSMLRACSMRIYSVPVGLHWTAHM